MMAKYCAMLLFAVGTAASRSEGMVMLQAGSLVERLHKSEDRNTRLVSMKEQVLAFAAAGVPAEAKPFLQTIRESLENDVLVEIGKERNLTKASHDDLYENFGNAHNDYTTSMNTLNGAGADAVSGKKTDHMDCRTQQSTDYDETVTCHGQLATAHNRHEDAKDRIKELKDDLDICEQGSWATADVPGLQDYRVAVGEGIASRVDKDAKTAECARLDGELATQKNLCDGEQMEYEAEACTNALGVKSAVDVYTSDYAEAKSSFEAQFSGWEVQNGDRIHQCRLVRTLICYVQSLENNDDKTPLQNAIDVCDAGREDHACDEVSFTHGSSPGASHTADIPSAPCQESFDYGTWPRGTAVGPCAACSGL